MTSTPHFSDCLSSCDQTFNLSGDVKTSRTFHRTQTKIFFTFSGLGKVEEGVLNPFRAEGVEIFHPDNYTMVVGGRFTTN